MILRVKQVNNWNRPRIVSLPRQIASQKGLSRPLADAENQLSIFDAETRCLFYREVLATRATWLARRHRPNSIAEEKLSCEGGG